MKNLICISIFLLLISCANDNQIKRIKSIEFETIESQRRALDSLVQIINSNKESPSKEAERKFLAAFPSTWARYKEMYKNDDLYTEDSHIHVLGQFQSIDQEILFNKVIDFSINGR
jgi:hypothetical protein